MFHIGKNDKIIKHCSIEKQKIIDKIYPIVGTTIEKVIGSKVIKPTLFKDISSKPNFDDAVNNAWFNIVKYLPKIDTSKPMFSIFVGTAQGSAKNFKLDSYKKEMNQIKKCKRLLIVGTPCQLYALEKYARKKCEELFILCIFCKQQKTFESTRFIAKLAGVKLNQISDLKTVSYRGAGWPGYCVLNGKSVPYGIAAGMPFGKKLWSVPGCDVCGNPFGEHADITVFDPWIIDKSNEDGRNVIAVSSEKGMNIIQSVPNIDITPLSFNDAIPTLMFDDIKKKNKLIPFFRNKETNSNIISHGKKFTKQRQHLQDFLIKSPKYPTIIYKVLGRIIKDPR